MTPYWYRLAIDLDPALNPIGASWAVTEDDKLVSYGTLTLPAPFDSPVEAFIEALDELARRFGKQLPLK